MHLVLGPHRFDLRERTVLIARVRDLGDRPRGADALWLDGTVVGPVPDGGLPVGAVARDAGDVARLADAGVALVGATAGDREAHREAARRGLGVLVTPDDLPSAASVLPAGQVLVEAPCPIDGAVACCSVDADGPAAWGRAAVVLAAGVRVVRSPGAASMRRVATVVDRLRAERHEAGAR